MLCYFYSRISDQSQWNLQCNTNGITTVKWSGFASLHLHGALVYSCPEGGSYHIQIYDQYQSNAFDTLHLHIEPRVYVQINLEVK